MATINGDVLCSLPFPLQDLSRPEEKLCIPVVVFPSKSTMPIYSRYEDSSTLSYPSSESTLEPTETKPTTLNSE